MALPVPDNRAASITAVRTTNIFCRTGCPAPSPLAANVRRYGSAREALFAGFRPCLRCRPLTDARPRLTHAELRRAERLRPVLRAARDARRYRPATSQVVLHLVDTPLGQMLAGTVDDGICLLEFTDRPMLPTQLNLLETRLRRPLVAGRHRLLDELAAQLAAYFGGSRQTFELPLVAPGSPFQERAWSTLRQISPGTTLTYEELAMGAGRPGAQRAAGTANGANRIAVLIPCHRVIRKNGDVGGYGGGSWRKAWLLDHERTMAT